MHNRAQLDSYYLLYAVQGDFEARRGNLPAATGYFRQALQLTQLKSEQRFLSNRIRDLDEQRNETVSTTA